MMATKLSRRLPKVMSLLGCVLATAPAPAQTQTGPWMALIRTFTLPAVGTLVTMTAFQAWRWQYLHHHKKYRSGKYKEYRHLSRHLVLTATRLLLTQTLVTVVRLLRTTRTMSGKTLMPNSMSDFAHDDCRLCRPLDFGTTLL